MYFQNGFLQKIVFKYDFIENIFQHDLKIT